MHQTFYKPKTISDWLSCHGDRTEKDLKKDEDGLFVLMGNGEGGTMKVYLPKELL